MEGKLITLVFWYYSIISLFITVFTLFTNIPQVYIASEFGYNILQERMMTSITLMRIDVRKSTRLNCTWCDVINLFAAPAVTDTAIHRRWTALSPFKRCQRDHRPTMDCRLIFLNSTMFVARVKWIFGLNFLQNEPEFIFLLMSSSPNYSQLIQFPFIRSFSGIK